MKKIFWFIFLFLLIDNVYCQKIRVKNIHYRIIDEKVEIYYDLPATHDTINVKLTVRKKSSPNYSYRPQYVSGSIGIGRYSGTNKKIVWYYKKEPKNILTGNGFYFTIIATKWTKVNQILNDNRH